MLTYLEADMKSTRQPRYGDIFAGHDDGAAMAELARVKWAEYRAEIEGRGQWRVSTATILDRLVRALVEYETYYPLAIADGPVRISGDGGQYVNMLWSNCNKLSEQAAKLEKALMLTPESMGDKTQPAKGGDKPSGADKYLGRHAH